jgi:predicted metal-dependent enzyme (double-stranded beta helix superfamily)
VRELVTRAVREPAAIIAGLGEPHQASVEVLYASDALTILNGVFGPWMTVPPHDHRMWAVIGIYSGREDNIFWRRIGEAGASKVEAAGARSLCLGDVEMLGKDIVHSVINPIPRCTGAIHVYGGDFFGPGRTEWDAESLTERPFDFERNKRLFEEADARFRAV